MAGNLTGVYQICNISTWNDSCCQVFNDVHGLHSAETMAIACSKVTLAVHVRERRGILSLSSDEQVAALLLRMAVMSCTS
jgi:hypothetical protein